jgi:hypothetical protein
MNNTNDQELAENLTIKLMLIMENWGLSDGEKLALLRLEDKIKPRHLYQYQRGSKSFDLDSQLVEFSQMLLGIDDALKTSYPANQNYGQIWLKRVQKKFKGKTPLELMLRDKAGMKKVWHFLDCTQSWQD